MSKLVKGNNIKVKFNECRCIFQDRPCTDEELGHGEKEYGSYRFPEGGRRTKEKKREVNDKDVFVRNVKKTLRNVKLNVMHARLGHSSSSKMQHLDICDCKGLKVFYCDTCHVSKHHKLPFSLNSNRAKEFLDLIHVDLWGPYTVKTISRASYFLITIVDDYCRVT